MKKTILSISGMSCSACSSSLEKYLKQQEKVIDATVNLVMQQASITYDDTLSIEELNKFVEEAGFKSMGVYEEASEKRKQNNKKPLIIFSILSLVVLYISMSHMINFPTIPFLNMEKYPINYSLILLILTIPFLIYGIDIFKNGYKNIIHKSPNMDTLVSIGVIASFIYSVFGTIMILKGKINYVENLYFESSCIVLYFIKLGRFIDSKSKEKTKEAIKSLVTITPTKSLLKTKDGIKEVNIDEVNKNDILACNPGMRIAVDGEIVDGISHFDESFITGEAIPIKKTKKDKVVAGSINIDGSILYKAEKIGKESTISEIVRLVVEATNTKAPISRVADKISSIFVPIIMIISTLTFIIYLLLGFNLNISLTHFVTVLVVACPCALGLATPLAIVVSEGLCAKNGILVKKSEILENACKIDTIVFDKTGTLTYGNLKISKIYNYSDYNEQKLLKIVASIESLSTHPIASSFKQNDKLLEVTNFKNIEGMGLKANLENKLYYVGNDKIIKKLNIINAYEKDEEKLRKKGNSIIYVVEDEKIIALIGVKDIIRNNSKKVITTLKQMNKEIIMLTGDNEETAQLVAKEIGIEKYKASIMPKDKTAIIKDLMKNGKKVMMIGDGINDAPSLATATIGISISAGTDIANNSADVILMNNNLMSIINLITISKKTIKNIKQNLFWAFFYNSLMIPIATGILSSFNINMNPMIASFAMTVSSLTVVFNALRLKKIKLERN